MRKTTTGRAVLAAALLLFAPALGACGGDDDGGDASDTTTTVATSETTAEEGSADAAASEEFCTAFTGLDAAFKNAPEDPAEMEAFVAEQVTPNLDTIRGDLPEAVADEVSTMADTVDEVVSTGNFDLFSEEAFSEASVVVYGSMGDLCAVPVVEVEMVDYAYTGVPETLDAGLTSFVVHNESASGETHQIELVKVADGVDLTAEEILGSSEEELDGVIDTFGGQAGASAGLGSGTTVELTPGRWVFACLIPVGSVDGQEGTGVGHWEHGMVGEFEVA